MATNKSAQMHGVPVLPSFDGDVKDSDELELRVLDLHRIFSMLIYQEIVNAHRLDLVDKDTVEEAAGERSRSCVDYIIAFVSIAISNKCAGMTMGSKRTMLLANMTSTVALQKLATYHTDVTIKHLAKWGIWSVEASEDGLVLDFAGLDPKAPEHSGLAQ